MENFECNAPMFHNFEYSSVVENDDADKFFDLDEATTSSHSGTVTEMTQPHSEQIQTVVNSSNSGTGEAMNTSEIVEERDAREIATHLTPCRNGEPMEESPQVMAVLDRAMRNLLSVSKGTSNSSAQRGTGASDTPKLKGCKVLKPGSCSIANSSKRKGSPMQHCQPRKFISMAEAVRAFQTHTPDRFHSRPNKANGNISMQHKIAGKIRSTVPHSPNLTSKLRSRPVHYMTREEQEEKELEEMKAHQVKPCPFNPKVLERPKVGIRVERKPLTVPEPFNFTEVIRKKKVVAPEIYRFTARPVPASIFENTLRLPKKKELPLTSSMSPTYLKKSKVMALSLDVKDGMQCVTEKAVHNFGVPTAGSVERKRATEVQPFSFEERDKQLLKKKEEVIQKYLEEEKKNREFHAKPVPACLKSPVLPVSRPVTPTLPVLFNFQMEKRGISKQDLLKQKLEEEAREQQRLAQFKARPATVLHKDPFEPKRSERPLTDVTAIELNTERRAKEREEFDNKVRMEQAELERLIKLREEERLKAEMEEVARLRREAVHKANPVRRYRPMDIHGSDKPLTDPLSPAFCSRNN